MHRLILLVSAGVILAPAQIPASLWPQVAVGAPGTNDTRRNDILPGQPGSPVTPVVSGGIVGIPVGGQQNTGAPAPAPGVPSIVTGPGGPGAPRTAGGGPGGPSGAGGALAPAIAPAPNCNVILSTTRAELGPNGGPVEIAIAPLPSECRPTVGASGTWLQLAANGMTPNSFKFSAAPNPTPIARSASVVVGDQIFTVEQAGLITTRLAAAPGKVVIGLSPKYKQQKRELTIWTDKPATPLTVESTAPWLRVAATKSRKNGARLFDVVVDTTSLAAGTRNEGAIVVSADGAPPLAIPVVVEGISRR